MIRTLRRTALALMLSAAPLAAGAQTAPGQGAPSQPPAAGTATVAIQGNQPGPVYDRRIFTQFAEHLGHGIYEGLWVGKNSKIPNTNGFRNDVVAALRNLKVPVIRWPGGCFADEYNWREGIGPQNKRPVKINTHWGGVTEPNTVGTHEFFELLRQVGAEAYVAGNVGNGSPREMAEWVEYMTRPPAASPTSAPGTATRRPGRCRSSASATSCGAAAATCGPSLRLTRPAATRPSSRRRPAPRS